MSDRTAILELPANHEGGWPPLRWRGGVKADGTRTASVSCGNGHISSLSGHTIKPDGQVDSELGDVFPSLVCPWGQDMEHIECDWHENVTLVGWDPTPQVGEVA